MSRQDWMYAGLTFFQATADHPDLNGLRSAGTIGGSAASAHRSSPVDLLGRRAPPQCGGADLFRVLEALSALASSYRKRRFVTGIDGKQRISKKLFDRGTTVLSVDFDYKIKRGDLRRLAPRKKLLKSCADSLESLRAFRFLARTPFDRCTTAKGTSDGHYTRSRRNRHRLQF